MGGRRLRYGMMLAGLILAMHGQLGQTAAQGNPCASRDMADIPQEAVKAAVHEVIDQNKQANDGKFIFKDNRTGRDLELEFEDFRVVRGGPWPRVFSQRHFSRRWYAREKICPGFLVQAQGERP